MRQNTGEPFFHPFTRQLIDTGTWYQGNAHQEHENSPVEEKQLEPDKESLIPDGDTDKADGKEPGADDQASGEKPEKVKK